MVEFDQYFSTYQMPPETARKLTEAFAGMGKLGLAYQEETYEFHAKKAPRDVERVFRGLDQYCATAVAQAFDTQSGAEFFDRILEIRADKREASIAKKRPEDIQYGVLLKGLPEDTGTKALIMIGIKALLGESDTFYGIRQELTIPELVKRDPNPGLRGLPFHRDKEYNNRFGFGVDSSPDRFSYLLMASAQRQPLSAPTVFKRVGDSNEDHVGHVLKPDELLISNNKDVKHTTGEPVEEQGSGSNWTSRYLLRYAVANTTLGHDLPHLRHIKDLRDEKKVPTDQAKLKEWLLAEASRSGEIFQDSAHAR